MTPHYKMIEVGGKELAVFYPQYKDDDGYKIIDPENRFPIELKNHAEYMSFLETLIEREQELKDGLTTLADLIEEMDMLSRGPKGDTRYMWVKYADDAEGNGMSDDPTGKKYIGFAFNKDTETPSDEPADYRFVKYVADYEGLEIGGRNLLPNTDFKGEIGDRQPEGWTSENLGTDYDKGELVISPFDPSKLAMHIKVNNARYYIQQDYFVPVNAGEKLTISVNATSKDLRIWWEFNENPNRDTYVERNTNFRFTKGVGNRLYETLTVPEGANYFYLFRLGIGVIGVSSGEVIFEGIKIEKGTVATDWTPAPEDIYARIDETNYVIDTEMGDDYILKKFSDGTMEISGMQEFNDVSYNSAGAIYRSGGLNVDFPVEFADDNVFVTLSSSNATLWVDLSGNSSATGFPFRAFSYNSNPSDFTVTYQAVGRWR